MRSLSLVLLFVAVLMLLGCGRSGSLETAPVTGVVNYNGQPLKFGTVSFRPAAGSPATGTIQSDGTFTLSTYGNGDGAIIGMNEVLVTATDRDAGTAGEVAENTEMTAPKMLIPQKYTSFSTSELTADVVAGKTNTFTFDLKDQ
ncbi:lipoprotein [Bremerella cremea]|uniref:lipoprotein n=1 Tax=Bremerella cremea TaxID=1031537 RepID=UPI0031EFC7AB